MTATPATDAPKSCPACDSTHLKTTSKVADGTAYWRCERCGEVWNAARRAKSSLAYRRPPQRWPGH